MNEKILLIGIDCAAQTSTLGLARAEFSVGQIVVTDVRSMKYTSDIDDIVADWINDHGTGSVLLALDAPLGWPITMGPVLSGHVAGEPTQPSEAFLGADRVGDAANLLFRRNTDRVVAEHIKTPFDIGADKIARVAHATLCLLARLREALNRETKRKLCLSWYPGPVTGPVTDVGAIEVYPAATLQSHGLMVEKYKGTKQEHEQNRRKLMPRLKKKLTFGGPAGGSTAEAATVETDHALDAVVCCLAAADFLTGNVIAPKSAHERSLAEKEGWIWVASPAKKTGGRRPSAP